MRVQLQEQRCNHIYSTFSVWQQLCSGWLFCYSTWGLWRFFWLNHTDMLLWAGLRQAVLLNFIFWALLGIFCFASASVYVEILTVCGIGLLKTLIFRKKPLKWPAWTYIDDIKKNTKVDHLGAVFFFSSWESSPEIFLQS